MSPPDRAALAQRDADDPLARFRGRFELPEGVVYLDGNSLGALPCGAADAVGRALRDEWGRDLITSWVRHGWVDLSRRVAARLAPMIGAGASELAVCDSTSVNLFKLLAAALQLRPERMVVLSERLNFPTDLYIAQGLGELLGGRVELRLVDEGEVEAALNGQVAVLMLTHVDYRTGRMHDMAWLTARAHEAGALVLWDLAHSAGAMPVDLSGCDADLAVGCGYKFLNGGPGAPAFLYVAQRHLEHVRQPLSGWFGHIDPFVFDEKYRPAAGIDRFMCGTPPILSLRALETGVDLCADADMRLVRQKSLALAEVFIELFDAHLGKFGFALATPRDGRLRGSQVSLRHEQGYPIMQALIAGGVIGDFRAPDILRFGLTPLYTRFVDIHDAVTSLCRIMENREWDRAKFRQRAKVT